MKMFRNSIPYILSAGIGFAQVAADSGWTFQNPMTTGNALHGVSALNTENASHHRDRAESMFAVGDNGTIVRTMDGGATWVQISSGTNAALNGASFAEANTGIAVGSAGAILRTTDGGATWIQLPSITTVALNGVCLSGD